MATSRVCSSRGFVVAAVAPKPTLGAEANPGIGATTIFVGRRSFLHAPSEKWHASCGKTLQIHWDQRGNAAVGLVVTRNHAILDWEQNVRSQRDREVRVSTASNFFKWIHEEAYLWWKIEALNDALEQKSCRSVWLLEARLYQTTQRKGRGGLHEADSILPSTQDPKHYSFSLDIHDLAYIRAQRDPGNRLRVPIKDRAGF